MKSSAVHLSAGYSLTFDIGPNRWTRMALVTPNERHELGADNAEIISARFRRAFGKSAGTGAVGEIDGTKIAGILSLSEKHATLYLGRTDSNYLIFFQNAEGKRIAKVHIDSAAATVLSGMQL